MHALEESGLKDFKLTDYRQHSIGGGSATESAAFIQLQTKLAELPMDVVSTQALKKSGSFALVSAYNRVHQS